MEEGMQSISGYQTEGTRRCCIHLFSGLSVVIMMVMGVRLNCITLWSAAGGQQMNMEHWLKSFKYNPQDAGQFQPNHASGSSNKPGTYQMLYVQFLSS
jgi:hypothetical protein